MSAAVVNCGCAFRRSGRLQPPTDTVDASVVRDLRKALEAASAEAAALQAQVDAANATSSKAQQELAAAQAAAATAQASASSAGKVSVHGADRGVDWLCSNDGFNGDEVAAFGTRIGVVPSTLHDAEVNQHRTTSPLLGTSHSLWRVCFCVDVRS